VAHLFVGLVRGPEVVERHQPSEPVVPDDDVEERVLSPGQEVCAFGVLDRRAGTLTGRRVLGVERIDVLTGDPHQVADRIMRKARRGLMAMGILFVLSHGLVGGLILFL
ncbi:MAG: hypothetical protein AAFY88_09070, partial [Acidobacteriota bacterium]